VRPITAERTVTSTLEGETIGMTLAEDAAEHLMGVLTDLYEDRELAVIRELSTNARDAHLDAGNPAPIEVELPSTLRPVLIIRDRGTGLSADDLRAIYTRYGASTKRDSNDFNGTLGLGSKSPLTYTDQFTLVTTKNGTRIHASVALNERGVGELTIAHTEHDASYQSGTEIQVPARRSNEFESKAREFFSYWDEGTVLLNGKAPTRVAGLQVSERILIADAGDRDVPLASDRHRVVMAGVSYPAEFPNTGMPYTKRIVAFVPTGTVGFTPNREALADVKRTRDALGALETEFASGAEAAAREAVEAAPSKAAALAAVEEWRSIAVLHAVEWRGQRMPEHLANPHNGMDGSPYGIVKRLQYSGQRKNSMDSPSRIETHTWPRRYWVTNFKPTKFAAPHRRKLEVWAENQGIEKFPEFVICVNRDVPPQVREWVAPERIIDWNDLRALKVESGAGNGTATVSATGERYEVHHAAEGRGSYQPNEATQHDAAHLAALAKALPVFYFAPPERATRWGTDYPYQQAQRVKALLDVHPGATILRMPVNRTKKFLRLVPEAVEGNAAIADAFEVWKSTIPADEWAALTAAPKDHWLTKLDPSAIADPELRAAVEARVRIRDARDRAAAHAEELRRWEAAGLTDAQPTRARRYGYTDPDPDELSRYPLVADNEAAMPSDAAHILTYINAAYAANKKGQ
jgi:hypothetical protein